MRFALWRKLQLNQRNRFLNSTAGHRIGRCRMRGEINRLQLIRHFFADFNRRNHINDIQELVSDVVACQLVIKQILDVIDVIAPVIIRFEII